MARGKKKEILTPEERLQAALVPESEQPYKVPGNWCWTYIKSGFDVTSSKRVHKEDWLSHGIPFYRTRELVKLSENGFVDNELFISEKLYDSFVEEYGAPQEGDLLISGVGTIGVPYVIKENKKFYFKDGNIIWFRNLGLFHPKYVYFLYKSAFIDNQIHQMASGTTVDTYTIINANATVVPLPPLPEQQRIVDRIESLFARLDEAKQKAQDALDSFETRKAAILHKAFTGELTAQWRKEHGVGMESWDYPRFEDCILKMQNGLSKRSGNSGVPFVVLRLANLSDDGFVTDDLREILLNEKEQKNYSLRANDVLMIRVNGSKDNVGKQFLFYGELKWAFCDHIIRITYKTNLSPKYMVYFSKTNAYRRYIEDNMVSSAGQNTISRKGMASLIIPLPLMNEQAEIVRILDDLLAKEQQAKEAAEGVLEQIDLMKKAILARAFRGELGTNDPREESAVELLKQVL